ncbi:hypothetical protein ACA097_26765 [Pseudomonas sp. QL9]|uniref:hypothetical protein n=1 Tax=Pseudomonas sp. QL9 TaxID=3242725 RepID=UPI00352AF70A
MNPCSLIPSTVCGLLLLVSLGGCAQTRNHDFAPPPGGETVSVTVKVPKDLAADTMRVMYRSEKCPLKRSDGSGERYEIDGAHAIEVVPQRQGQSDLYEARLARDGGGACQWKLSNVTLGVHYENTSQFGRKVEYAGGGEVIIIFDLNMPQQQSMYGVVDIDGDVLVREEYFPWLSEIFLNGHREIIELLGSQKFLTYRSLSARKVAFEPVFYSNMVVKTIGVKSFGEGEKAENIYPDGTREFANSDPNIERLKEMVGK